MSQNDGLFAYNINLGGLRGRDAEAQADAKALHAHAHLLMTVPGSGIDGPGEIKQLREWEAVLEGSTIIRRSYNRKEGDWSLYAPPKEQVRIWRGQGLLSMLHDAPANEPSLNGTDIETNQRFVAREAELIYRCAEANIKYLSSAFSVGVPHESLIERGIYDPILKALDETYEIGGGISAHLYGLANGEAGERVGYEVLLDPRQARAAMSDTQWQLGSYYLLRRPDYFMRRADVIGVRRPRVYATEAKVDLIPDANWILNQLRSRFGLPEYNFDIRGIQSLLLYLAAMFPEMDYQQAVAHITAYFGRNIFYVDYIKAVCLFSLNWLWDTPQGHNYFNEMLVMFRKVYLPEINRILRGAKVMFPDASDERWQSGTLHASNTNVRSQAGRGNNVIGRIYQATEGYLLDGVLETDIHQEDFTWTVIRYLDEANHEITGYIASNFYTFDADSVDEEPPIIVVPQPEPPSTDITVKWLEDNVPSLVDRWLLSHVDELYLHIPDNQPDIPTPVARTLSRVLRFIAEQVEPEKEQEPV